MSALKRLKIDEKCSRVSWRNPRYADWKLTWSSDVPSEMKTWDVHRCVIAGGTRPAHFFEGATRDGVPYVNQSTDLSRVLPEACKEYVEKALDFIYSEPLGEISAHDVVPLMKIADVLQCPQLHNVLVDFIDGEGFGQSGTIEVLLKEACDLELFQVAESLVTLMPLSRLTALDFDILKINSLSLMRTVAKRLVQARMTQWESFVGHGKVTADGGFALSLPKISGESSRKSHWCQATGISQLPSKQQSWSIRLDRIFSTRGDRATHLSSMSTMLFGVVAGAPAESTSRNLDMADYTLASSLYSAGAYLIFYSDDSYGLASKEDSARDGAWNTIREGHKACHQGDIISVKMAFPDDGSAGDVEWHVNGELVDAIRKQVPRVPYSLCAELYSYKYEPLGVTLLEYTNI